MAAAIEDDQTQPEAAGDKRASALRKAAAGRPWPEWSALTLFAALVAFAIPSHEPFVDEAQAWQLARTLPLGSLFTTYLRYEGSPGLWHFLLWIMNRLHVSYAGMHWISGAIAVAGVSLLIFHSPFPRWLKLSLPFTYFLLFQYAVVARNYVLAPLLLFLVALNWKKSPWITVVGLGLLANVSLHTAVISGGLACIYAIEQIRNPVSAPVRNRRKLLGCTLLLLGLYAFAIWTAWPAHDMNLQRLRDVSPPFFIAAVQSLTTAVCQPPLLSVPFWGVVALWFLAQRKFLYLLPVLLFAIFSGAVYFTWWHAGLLIPALICLLWINWPEPGAGAGEFGRSCRVALMVMTATQILWSGYALYHDRYFLYSPDRAAAGFLKPFVDQGDRIAVTYVKNLRVSNGKANTSVGIQPYFDRNIFVNTPYSFWWWSDRDPSQDRYEAVLPSHPEIVVVEDIENRSIQPIGFDHPEFEILAKEGYRYRDAFCAAVPIGLRPQFSVCHVIFEYSGKAGGPGT
jgi:hypothetical protein